MAVSPTPRTGKGVKFYLGNATNVLTKLERVESVGLPQTTTDELETTHLESVAKEFIAGLTDFGEFDVVMQYDPESDTDTLVRAARDDQNNRNFKIEIPVGGGKVVPFTGAAYVKAYQPSALENGAVRKATLTLRCTGGVTQGAPVVPS